MMIEDILNHLIFLFLNKNINFSKISLVILAFSFLYICNFTKISPITKKNG